MTEHKKRNPYFEHAILADDDDLDLQIDLLVLATEFDPTDAEPFLWLGRCYKQLKKYDEAENSFKRAVQIFPEYSEALCGLGETYIRLNDFKKS